MVQVSKVVARDTVLHIACTADAAYLPHSAAMLASLVEHNDPASIHIHYLHPEDLAHELISKLGKYIEASGARIQFHPFPDKVIAGLPSWPGLRPIMWYRVMLAETLPDIKRVLYIDADCLVLDSLQPLWETNIDNSYVAAVTNIAPRIFENHPIELGLPDRASYFNSGVMLLNLERMRVNQSAETIMEFGRGNDLKWWDQDALNVFFHKERIRLHPRWNCMNCIFLFPESRKIFGDEIVDEAIKKPAIVHFEGPGPGKPWHFLSKHPFKQQYLRYRGMTPWPLESEEGKTLHNQLIRLLPFRGVLKVVSLENQARNYMRRLRSRLAGVIR